MRHLVLAMIVTATFAGCGGSGSEDGAPRPREPTPAGPRATGEEFARQVDALCKDTQPELAEIRAALTATRDAGRSGRVSLPKTFEAFTMLLRRAGTVTDRFEARLRSITAPSGERGFREALVRSLEQGSSNLRAQVSAAKRQDAVGLRELSLKGSLINAEQKGLIAGRGGFKFCGRR